MRRYLHCIIKGFVTILFMVSCKECYYVENELHGMWQVVSVERFSTGEVTEAHGNLYYLFQRSMVMLSCNNVNIPESMIGYIAYFDIVAPDSIGMGNFRVNTTGEGDKIDKEVEVPIDELYKFGLYNKYTIFHSRQSAKELIFTSDSARIVMRKY